VRTRAVAAGVGAALAIALPAALVAQILDARRDEDAGTNPLTYGLAALVLVGIAVGGGVTGRQRPNGPAAAGAAVGAVAVVIVLVLGIARRLVAGDDVAWATVPGTVVVAAALGAAASALAARAAGRTRP
jgi:O-antigen/teichoic acid export membrane protein